MLAGGPLFCSAAFSILADSWLNVWQQTVRMIDIVASTARKLNSQLAGGQPSPLGGHPTN